MDNMKDFIDVPEKIREANSAVVVSAEASALETVESEEEFIIKGYSFDEIIKTIKFIKFLMKWRV